MGKYYWSYFERNFLTFILYNCSYISLALEVYNDHSFILLRRWYFLSNCHTITLYFSVLYKPKTETKDIVSRILRSLKNSLPHSVVENNKNFLGKVVMDSHTITPLRTSHSRPTTSTSCSTSFPILKVGVGAGGPSPLRLASELVGTDY